MGRLNKPMTGRKLSPRQLKGVMMQPPNGQPQQMPTLTINLSPQGGVQVLGPITNKGLCYMMLELARDAIRDFNQSKEVNTSIPGPEPVVGGISLPTEEQVKELVPNG